MPKLDHVKDTVKQQSKCKRDHRQAKISIQRPNPDHKPTTRTKKIQQDSLLTLCNYLTETPSGAGRHILLERPLKPRMVRLPHRKKLPGTPRTGYLDQHPVPGLPLPRRLVCQPRIPLRQIQRPQKHHPLPTNTSDLGPKHRDWRPKKRIKPRSRRRSRRRGT